MEPPAAITEESQGETKRPDKEEEEKKKEVIKGSVVSVKPSRDRKQDARKKAKAEAAAAAKHVAVEILPDEMFCDIPGYNCFYRFLAGQTMQLIVFLIISTVTYFASMPILLTYDCDAMTGDEWAAAGCKVPNPNGTCWGPNCPVERNIGRTVTEYFTSSYISSSTFKDGLKAIQPLDGNGDEINPLKYGECFIACYPESLEPGESADNTPSPTPSPTYSSNSGDDSSTTTSTEDKTSLGYMIKDQLKQLKNMFETLVPKDPPILDGGKFRVIRELNNDNADNQCSGGKQEKFIDVATAPGHDTLFPSSETGITSRETCSDLELPKDKKYTEMKDLLEMALWTQGAITVIKSLVTKDGSFYLMIKCPKVPCGKRYPLKSIKVFGAFLIVLASLASAVICFVTAVISLKDGFNVLFLFGLLFAGVVSLIQFREEYRNMMKERKQKGVGKVAFGCAEAPPLTDEEKAALRTCQRLCIGLVIFFACMIFIPVLISSPEVLMWMAIVVATLVGYRYRETLANIAYAVQIFVEGLFTLTYFFLYLACFVAFVAVVAVNIYWWVTGTGSYSDY